MQIATKDTAVVNAFFTRSGSKVCAATTKSLEIYNTYDPFKWELIKSRDIELDIYYMDVNPVEEN